MKISLQTILLFKKPKKINMLKKNKVLVLLTIVSMTIGYFFGGGLIKPISDQELSQISSVNSELIDKATDYENMINYKNRIDSVLVSKKN